ncbi:hypothetical protein HK102_011587, partial [Quaeritorhiza haematococci]
MDPPPYTPPEIGSQTDYFGVDALNALKSVSTGGIADGQVPPVSPSARDKDRTTRRRMLVKKRSVDMFNSLIKDVNGFESAAVEDDQFAGMQAAMDTLHSTQERLSNMMEELKGQVDNLAHHTDESPLSSPRRSQSLSYASAAAAAAAAAMALRSTPNGINTESEQNEVNMDIITVAAIAAAAAAETAQKTNRSSGQFTASLSNNATTKSRSASLSSNHSVKDEESFSRVSKMLENLLEEAKTAVETPLVADGDLVDGEHVDDEDDDVVSSSGRSSISSPISSPLKTPFMTPNRSPLRLDIRRAMTSPRRDMRQHPQQRLHPRSVGQQR